MNEQPFFINLDDYEIIPESVVAQADETPRQYLLRMTDRDFPYLSYNDRDISWQELREIGAMPFISRIMQLAYKPHIFLRKKE